LLDDQHSRPSRPDEKPLREDYLLLVAAEQLNRPARVWWTGEIDLSVGTTLALAGMVAIRWQGGLGIGGSVAVSLATCGLLGFINGVLVGRLRFNSITTTLETMITISASHST
jgi:predicted ABC-type sugar transport system permease subunit